MAKNKPKTSGGKATTKTTPATQTSNTNTTTNIEELLAENKALKAERQELLKQIDEDRKKQELSANISTQNRFEVLHENLLTNPQQEDEMDYQTSEDLKLILNVSTEAARRPSR